MTDPIETAVKTDADKALAESKSIISDLNADEEKASGWVRTHIAWVIGICCLIAGIVLGHVIK